MGSAPLSLYEQLVSAAGGGFRVEVTDEAGEFALRYMRLSLAHTAHWPTFGEEKRVMVRPGESVEWTEEHQLQGYAALGPAPLKEPGIYRLSVSMDHSPVVGWPKDEGWSLESKPVSFEVCQ